MVSSRREPKEEEEEDMARGQMGNKVRLGGALMMGELEIEMGMEKVKSLVVIEEEHRVGEEGFRFKRGRVVVFANAITIIHFHFDV